MVDIRAVHLDLKGCQPTFERLMQLLDLFAAARYNAVLVEWEDTFPWTVDERFQSPTAYTAEEVKKFVARCAELSIEIIPLVQCLGHMETPLNVPDYEKYREVADNCQDLNPLAEGARELVQSMVDDMLKLMPDVKYLHLGGDEAGTFGTHPDTKAYIEKQGKGALYMHHIEPILDSLNERGVRPILWNDMINQWEDDAVIAFGKKADVCVWGYQRNPFDRGYAAREQMERYKKLGVSMWGAGAYKGATRAHGDVADYDMHEANALTWAGSAKDYEFVGLIATAWSRYCTIMAQCETIEASMDSLVNVGIIFHDGAAPEGGVKSCKRFLDSVGEGDCYRRCHKVAEELGKARDDFWGSLRVGRESMALIASDVRRKDGKAAARICGGSERAVKWAKELESEFRKAFEGLMPDMWIDEYLMTRVQPMKDELVRIKADADKL